MFLCCITIPPPLRMRRHAVTQQATAQNVQGWLASAAIGATTACLTMTAHEVLGHAAVCLANGGQIVELTSAFFRCTRAGAAIDAAGPLANFLVGMVGYFALTCVQRTRTDIFLFVLMFTGFNLLLGCGTLVYSGVLNIDDLAFAARELGLAPAWRGGAILGGGTLYALVTYGLADRARRYTTIAPGQRSDLAHNIRVAYLAGALALCLASAFYAPAPGAAMFQGFLEIAVAGAGMWRVAAAMAKLPSTHYAFLHPTRSRTWLRLAAITLALFAATLGRGLG